MQGCEPHSANFGGTILLTRTSGHWETLWYRAGVVTSRCHKVTRRDGREILVCIGSAGAQGTIETSLFMEDLLTPKTVLMASSGTEFFTAADNTRSCGESINDAPTSKPRSITIATVEKVEFPRNSVVGSASLTVTAEFGRHLGVGQIAGERNKSLAVDAAKPTADQPARMLD